MSSNEESVTPEVLDEAIKILYSSRPAKAAAMLGLLDPEQPISLAPKVAEYKVAVNYQGVGGHAPVAMKKITDPGKIGDMGAAGSYNVDKNKGPSAVTEPRPSKTISIAKVDGMDNSGVASPRGERMTLASLNKRAMTDQEYLMYQAGLGPMMEQTGDPSLTPTQLAALGGGTIGVAGANRLRAKNVAGRELKQIRKQYLKAVKENTLTKQQLRNLNKELKLRGAKPMLSMAPSVGIADARMAQAEKNLTSKVLKNRYRGALPLLAAGLIGTVAYNKLNEG